MNFQKKDEINKNFSKVIKNKFSEMKINQDLILELNSVGDGNCMYVGGYKSCKKCPFNVEFVKRKRIFKTYSTRYCMAEHSLKYFSYMINDREIDEIKFPCKDRKIKNKDFKLIRDFFVYFLTNKKIQEMVESTTNKYNFFTKVNEDIIYERYFVSEYFILALRDIKRGKF